MGIADDHTADGVAVLATVTAMVATDAAPTFDLSLPELPPS